MMNHKITPFLDYNYWLKSLDTQHNEPTNTIIIKDAKVDKPTNKKALLYNFGD